MAKPDLFWTLFKSTGSIKAYLAYRQLHQTAT
ncbi:MAG: YqzL family protein [Vulcanimicrobiaceae bacterium]